MKDALHFEKTLVFEGNRLRAVCFFPDRPRLLVCFDHWRQVRDGFPSHTGGAQSLERFDCAVLNIHSTQNDWLLNAELPALRAALRRFCAGFESVTAFGFSMGGYGALLLARDLHLDHAVLISPQYSIQPKRVPFERRYLAEARDIDSHQDVFDLEYGKSLLGTLIYDPLWKQDLAHRRLICRDFPAITPVPLWAGGHPAIKIIYEADKWGKFLSEVAQPFPNPHVFRRLHKDLRSGSHRYLRVMLDHLSVRSNKR